MNKDIVETTSMDRSQLGIEMHDASNPDSTVRLDSIVFVHQPSSVTVDVSMTCNSRLITDKNLRAMISRIRRKHKRPIMSANKGSVVESLFRKIQIDNNKTRGE